MIKNYNQFLNDSKFNPIAYQYIHGEISEKTFNDYIFSELLNEGVIDNIVSIYNSIKTKLLDTFFTFLVEAMKTGQKILSKLLSIAKKWTNWLKNFNEKHPVLAKAIMIFIIVMIILIISSQSAHGAEVVDGKLKLTNLDEINAAYGYVDANYQDLLSHVTTNSTEASKVAFEAKVYLKDIVDGKIDNPTQISEGAMKLANFALSSVKKWVDVTNDKGDSQMLSTVLKYMKDGMSHAVEFSKNGNLSSVILK